MKDTTEARQQWLATLARYAPPKQRRGLTSLATVHFALCLTGYVLLRALIQGPANVSSLTVYGGKWARPAAVDDLVLFSACMPLALLLYRSLRPALAFTALSLPYLIPVLLTGVLRELRLLVPLVLCILCTYLLLDQESGSGLYAVPHDDVQL